MYTFEFGKDGRKDGLYTHRPIKLFELGKEEIQSITEIKIEAEESRGPRSASQRWRNLPKEALMSAAPDLKTEELSKLIVVVNFTHDSNDSPNEATPDVVLGIGVELDESKQAHYFNLGLPANRAQQGSTRSMRELHKKLNHYLQDVGYLSSCRKRSYVRPDQQVFEQQFKCRNQLFCMKQILYGIQKKDKDGRVVDQVGVRLKKYFEATVMSWQSQPADDQQRGTQLALATLVDYYKRKILLFFYIKENAEIPQEGLVVEIDLKLHLDQYGPAGVQPSGGYQNLFLMLFKRDKFFTPQFKISRKFSNIARNSLYIYWLQEDSETGKSQMLQFLDEEYQFKHLRGSVSTCDSGHFEKVHESLKDDDRDYTMLILKPATETLKGQHHFKKIELLRFIGERSDVFESLRSKAAKLQAENAEWQGWSLHDLQ